MNKSDNKIESNSIHDIRYENLRLFVYIFPVVTGISSSLAGVFFDRYFNLRMCIYFSFFVSLVFLTWFLLDKKNYKIIAIAVTLFLGCVLLPILIYYAIPTANTTAMVVLYASIAMAFLLDARRYWYIFLIVTYCNLYSLIKFFPLNMLISQGLHPHVYFFGFAVFFVLLALCLMFFIFAQEKNFESASRQIELSREKEKSASLAKSRFLANMSHEIRTPMNAVIGLAELGLREELSDQERNQMSIIKQSSYELLEIIDDVLFYSRLESGKIKLQPTECDSETLFRQILDAISEQTTQKDLKVQIYIDHNIPKVILGDAIQIRQIFIRLLFISIFLTENGRIMISVNAQRDDEHDKVRFICKIADTGCGLSEADLNAIEGAYNTYDSKQNSNLKGIGLKFNICEEIIKLMNGDIKLNSIEGVGLESLFSFEAFIIDPEPMIRVDGGLQKKVLIYVSDNRELESWKTIMEGFQIRPDYVGSYYNFERAIQYKKYDFIFLQNKAYPSVSNIISSYECADYTYVVADLNENYGDFDKCRILRTPVSCMSVAHIINNLWNVEDYKAIKEDVTYDCSDAKILVVDDNSVNLKVAIGIFKSVGADIDIAKNGMEAMQKMELMPYNLVFMDMVMPEWSGGETLKRMRMSGNKDMRSVPVIALTAAQGGNIRDEILEQGFQEYLAKPIKLKYLLQILLAFLPPELIKIIEGDNKSETDNKEEVKEEVDLLKQENKLNLKQGLSNLGNNEVNYIKVLNAYLKEGYGRLSSIKEAYEAFDMPLFTTYVHAVKSASASVGAMTVSEMFKDLESAGKSSNLGFIDSHFNDYMRAYEEILSKIKDYLSQKGKLNQ